MKRVITVLAVLAAGFALAGCGGDDETSSTTTVTEATTPTETETTETETTEAEPNRTVVRVTVQGGVPVGGIVRKSVRQDERAVLVVTSDVADEVHLHGYDLSADVVPGHRARIAFRATIPGRFEVELENRGVQIAELTVEP